MEDQVSQDRHLFELVRILSERKADETVAKAARILAEEDLVKATGFAKHSGSQSYKATISSVGAATVTLKQPVTVSVIADRVAALKKTIKRSVFGRVFQAKYSVVAKELSILEKSDHDVWLEVMECLSKKPGKIGVEIKNLEVL